MSATDVGWAPPGGIKDNKEENDALAWNGVAIATPWNGVAIATLSVEQRSEIGLGYRQTDQQRSYSYCRYYSMQKLFTNHRPAQQDHPLSSLRKSFDCFHMTQENNNGTSIQEHFNVWLPKLHVQSETIFYVFVVCLLFTGPACMKTHTCQKYIFPLLVFFPFQLILLNYRQFFHTRHTLAAS